MSNKIMMIIVAVLLVLVIGLGVGVFAIYSKLSSMPVAGGEPAHPKDEGKMGPVVALETFIVNLTDPGNKRYLRLTMQVELKDEKLVEKFNSRLVLVRDLILTVLPTKNFEELQSATGKSSLKTELLEKLNAIYGEPIIKKIFFTEFVVQ